MDRITLLYFIFVVWFDNIETIRVGPCPTNKIAPHDKAEWKTFGNLFNFKPNSPSSDTGNEAGPDCGSSINTADTDVYDPVHSEEEQEHQNDRPLIKPERPTIQGNNNGGLFNWWPGIISDDAWPTRPPRPQRPESPDVSWPTRPPRPQRPERPDVSWPTRPPRPQRPERPPFGFNNWFSGWFGPGGQGGFRPPKPTRPPYYDDATKPVHEYIEDDEVNIIWKPGAVVGGPSNQIVPVMQDLSNWSTVPRPRPTRPYIPPYASGQNNKVTKRGNQGIIGSFIDLFLERK